MPSNLNKKLRFLAVALLSTVYCLLPAASAQDQSANVEAGRRIFTGSCSMGYCHGLNGAGGGGPKLAGRKFSVKYLTMVISDGVPETTMPGFKSNLSKEQLGNLILYVQSLSSSNATEQQAIAQINPTEEHFRSSATISDVKPVIPGTAPTSTAITKEDRELMGDAAAGRTLFFNSSLATICSTCHSIAGRGGKLASDLTELASKPAKDILQSIAEPSAYVDEKFATLALTLKDGKTFTGVKRDEDTISLRLYDTSSLPPISRSFLKAEIAKTEKLKTSVMPGDYATKYSRQQLRDLIGFLKTTESAK